MASKCFYLNVFCILLISYICTAEILPDAGASSTERVHLSETWMNVTAMPTIESTSPINLTSLTLPDIKTQVNELLQVSLNKLEPDETLRAHNLMTQKRDHHLYYNSTIFMNHEAFKRFWVDMDKVQNTTDILPNSYRQSVAVKLNFDFPFYGYVLNQIIIATGGFISTGEYVHSWLSGAQYIAPLMANFDTSSSNSSSIKYVDNGTSFTVQWENVVLHVQPEEGSFTFQCTLFKNGDIVFAYKEVSSVIDSLSANQYPIKVGVSDAYIVDNTTFLSRKENMYEYHRVDIERKEIKNEIVILLNALDTCLDMKDCHSCVTALPHFECNWCENRCSNGMDRYRQDWIAKGCISTKQKSVEDCLDATVLAEPSVETASAKDIASSSAPKDISRNQIARIPKLGHHLYYNSSILYEHEEFQQYWVDMEKHETVRNILSDSSQIQFPHKSESYGEGVTVTLNFAFPFYGYGIKNVVVGTNGFLFTGDQSHFSLAESQYITPFLTNFLPLSSSNASVKFVDNGKAFTVQWKNVVLSDLPNEGGITFQCTLFEKGDIAFVYKRVSNVMASISSVKHPVEIGISDGYATRLRNMVNPTTVINEYHRIKLDTHDIMDETVVLLTPLPTCLDVKDCRSCLKGIPNFQCNWCGGYCTDGNDRLSSDWLSGPCISSGLNSEDKCPADDEPSLVQPQDNGNEVGDAGSGTAA